MSLGEHVVQDYLSLRLSLKAHPMQQLLRGTFAAQGDVQTRELAYLPADRVVQVRQRSPAKTNRAISASAIPRGP